MRIGFSLPQFGTGIRADEIAGYARRAEELGADGFWVSDRLLAPVDPVVGYAGADDFPEVFRAIHDPFALLTVAATATRRALIGSNVLNAPWYPPALLARSLTTIDLLSGGRLLVGLGSGWSPEEFQAANVPFAERGARLDECLDGLDAMWTGDPAELHGSHWTIPASHVDLRPAQRPRPPVYLAGFGPAPIRRLARRGDGWLPVAAPGAMELDPAAVAGMLAQIRQLAEQEGRDPASIGAILRVYPVATASLQDVADTIKRAEAEAGIDHVLVDLMYHVTSVEHALDLTGRVLELTRGA